MARLYVLNPTNQNYKVHYRLDYAIDGNGNRNNSVSMAPLYQDIPAGMQVEFGGDLNPTQPERIIQQIEEAFNAVHVSLIKTAKANGRVNLVWSLDKIIPRPICEDVKAHNLGFLTQRGEENRKNMALVTDYALRQIGDENHMESDPDVSVFYQTDRVDGVDNGEYLDQKIEVKADAPRPRGRPRKAA